MPNPPVADRATRGRQRRAKAIRRCNRALRRTVYFAILFIPYSFCAYVAFCPMPLAWRDTLPNYIMLYEYWVFLRCSYILLRYVWFAPLRAPLPLLLFLCVYQACSYTGAGSYDLQFYYDRFRQDRQEVVRMIANGELLAAGKPDHGTVLLPLRYRHTAFKDGVVSYERTDSCLRVFFSTGWDFFTYHQGF